MQSQGDQRSPGIIPLAVKDAFSIIQEVLYIELALLVLDNLSIRSLLNTSI